MRTVRTLLALGALVVLVAACSKDEVGPLPLPSSAFPTGTSGSTGSSGATGTTGGATGGTAATGGSGVLPTTSPGSATGNLTSGEITFEISGDLRLDRTLTQLISAIYSPPPGVVGIVWTAGGADATTIGIGGASFTGTQPTAPSLTITIAVQTAGGVSSFLSIDGECDVTIDVAAENELSGSFTCADLTSSTGEAVEIDATFDASG